MPIQLLGEAGPLVGHYWLLDGPATYHFGRDAACEFVLAGDASVSRKHAALAVWPPRAILRDSGSVNGFYINDRRPRLRPAPPPPDGDDAPDDPGEAPDGPPPEVVLAHGDRFRIGDSVFRIFIPYCTECDAELSPPFPESGGLRCPACEAAKSGSDASGRGRAEAPPPTLPGLSLLHRLRRGALGDVYLARRDGDDGELVTVKRVARHARASGEAERFPARLDAIRRLDHPNWVRIHDGGITPSRDGYIVREYVPGPTLEGRRLAHTDRRMPFEEALPFLRQALSGLAHLHAHGWVHRHLRPGHVFIDTRGGGATVKLADPLLFSPAQLAPEDHLHYDAGTGRPLAFAPPEQVADFNASDPAADVFALAATFYVALTGEAVYDFDAAGDPSAALLEGRIVAVSRRLPSLPRAFAAWLDQSLSLDPRARFPDATAMGVAFHQLRYGAPPPPKGKPS